METTQLKTKTTQIREFLKNWTLPISMLAGVIIYFAIAKLQISQNAEELTYSVLSHFIQPLLIFAMLFLSFSKVAPTDMRPHRWHLWVLISQMSLFILCSLLAKFCDQIDWSSSAETKVLLEGAMLCFVCPTATASAVITGKLGGSLSGVTTYLLLCNLTVSIIAPLFLTIVEPNQGMDFTTSFFIIMGKVFPLLILPLISSWAVRYFFPPLHRRIIAISGLSFYLWAIALAFAITVTTRSIANTTIGTPYILALAAISLVCCAIQFALGKAIGSRYDSPGSHENRITAGQAFGQKNTVFVIWLGYMFLNPVTAIVGGLYSVWHNIVNSYQLYKTRQSQ